MIHNNEIWCQMVVKQDNFMPVHHVVYVFELFSVISVFSQRLICFSLVGIPQKAYFHCLPIIICQRQENMYIAIMLILDMNPYTKYCTMNKKVGVKNRLV